MQTGRSLGIAALLLMGSAVSTFAQSSLPVGIVSETCAPAGQAGEKLRAGDLLLAVVRHIDPHKGMVTLDTQAGRVELAVTPEELQALHEGDVITVYVEEEILIGGEGEPQTPI